MASKSTSSNSPSPLSHSQRQLALSDPGCAIRPMIDRHRPLPAVEPQPLQQPP